MNVAALKIQRPGDDAWVELPDASLSVDVESAEGSLVIAEHPGAAAWEVLIAAFGETLHVQVDPHVVVIGDVTGFGGRQRGPIVVRLTRMRREVRP